MSADVVEVASQMLVQCFTSEDGSLLHTTVSRHELRIDDMVTQVARLGRFEGTTGFSVPKRFVRPAWGLAHEVGQLWQMALLATHVENGVGFVLLRRGEAVVTCDAPVERARDILRAVAP